MKSMLILLVACIAPAAFAGTTNVHCVNSSEKLANALALLSTSAANTDADEIRIHTGAYSAPEGGWVGSVTTHHALTVRGGYTDEGDTCTQQTLDASMTVLNGNDTSGVMTINTPLGPDSDIEVSGLTFQHGKGGGAFGPNAGGLKIGDPGPISNGKILVERNIFRDNSSVSDGFSQAIGGLLAATDGQSLIVRGNLFVNNTSPNAAAFLYSNNAIDVSNNTFAGNRSTDSAQIPVALDYFTFGGLFSTNNIYWDNAIGSGQFDIDLSAHLNGAKGATLVHDDIQTSTGTAVSATGTMQADPKFVGTGDFRLSVASTLIDAGVDDPSGGLAEVDLDGAPRIDAATADLGAYESSYVFIDGFE